MLNSGSEGNSFITRLVDINTGHNHNGRAVKGLVVKDSFHGRTFRAAMLTDTTQSAYEENKAYLLSSVIRDYKLTVEQNNLDALRAVFAEADRKNWFIETMYLEGIQGEGNPGSPLAPSFYALARELTLKHGSLLVIDNIQAGLRCTGDLSIVDFPGFATLPPPDFEVWAKAINAGQYPTSLIALAPRAAEWYRHGVYGNTMTGNPRACAVASAVLRNITPELRKNIVDCGKYALEQYTALMRELPNAIVKVVGTGLLYSVKLNAAHLTVVASDGVEMALRRAGVNVIHGGENALRFTPNLNVTREEIDMQVAHVRQILLQAEALLGELRPLESRNVSIQTAVGERGTSALCTVQLDGHLFDSGALTQILDLVEDEHARALVHNIQVGRNMGETSVATVQLFADDQSKVQRLLSMVGAKSSEHNVRLSVLSDAYEAMTGWKSRL